MLDIEYSVITSDAIKSFDCIFKRQKTCFNGPSSETDTSYVVLVTNRDKSVKPRI